MDDNEFKNILEKFCRNVYPIGTLCKNLNIMGSKISAMKSESLDTIYENLISSGNIYLILYSYDSKNKINDIMSVWDMRYGIHQDICIDKAKRYSSICNNTK